MHHDRPTIDDTTVFVTTIGDVAPCERHAAAHIDV